MNFNIGLLFGPYKKLGADIALIPGRLKFLTSAIQLISNQNIIISHEKMEIMELSLSSNAPFLLKRIESWKGWKN